jgi:multidrug resistance efflux pump
MLRLFAPVFWVSLMLSAPAASAGAAIKYPLGVSVRALVASVLVADGAHVAAGEVILKMDCRPLEQEIKVRAADLAAAQAVYERVRNGPRPDEIVIGEANVGVAQARSEEAEDAYARLKALTEGVTVTRAQLLEVRRDARISSAQLNDAQKRLALLRAGSRAEDVAEAQARRDSAEAQLSLVQAQLDQCALRAPVSGVVELRATPGQFVSDAVPTALAILTPDSPTH